MSKAQAQRRERFSYGGFPTPRSPAGGAVLDNFLFTSMIFACDGLQRAGATKLWYNLCLSDVGHQQLYYMVIGAYVVLALILLGAVANAFQGQGKDHRREDR